ncbi:hypothetical protein H2248_005720 [Termitomyces sp. 'cryptogamus']|nr:hypothetical protein H2248_005720 [Termitomyces sp. 'cryptogamus']
MASAPSINTNSTKFFEYQGFMADFDLDDHNLGIEPGASVDWDEYTTPFILATTVVAPLILGK